MEETSLRGPNLDAGGLNGTRLGESSDTRDKVDNSQVGLDETCNRSFSAPTFTQLVNGSGESKRELCPQPLREVTQAVLANDSSLDVLEQRTPNGCQWNSPYQIQPGEMDEAYVAGSASSIKVEPAGFPERSALSGAWTDNGETSVIGSAGSSSEASRKGLTDSMVDCVCAVLEGRPNSCSICTPNKGHESCARRKAHQEVANLVCQGLLDLGI